MSVFNLKISLFINFYDIYEFFNITFVGSKSNYAK